MLIFAVDFFFIGIFFRECQQIQVVGTFCLHFYRPIIVKFYTFSYQ